MLFAQVGDQGVQHVVAICPALQSLNLNGMGQLSDATLASLAVSCPGIQTLRLRGCVRITDAGVRGACHVFFFRWLTHLIVSAG